MEEPPSSQTPVTPVTNEPTPTIPTGQPAAPQPAPASGAVQSTTDVLGIVSLVTFFLGLQIVGIIVGAIGMRKAKREGYNGVLSIVGFWLNLAITVMLILGIILLLVVTTNGGVASKANDAKRKTDVSAIQYSLESYYEKYHSYPALAQLKDDTWVTANLTNISTVAFEAPGATVNSISATASITTYQYIPTPAGCTTVGKNCTGYTLTAMTETKDSSPIVKVSLGQ